MANPPQRQHRPRSRRAFLRDMAGLAGLGVGVFALASCAPAPPAAAPTAAPAAPPAAAPPTSGAAAPAAQPTSAPPAAAAKPAAAPAQAGAKAVVFRYMTGGFSQIGPDDELVKQYQEDAIRKEYGLNIDIRYESASWADIDQLMEVRLNTQGVDGLQRHDRAVSRWISRPGLIRDIDAEVKQHGKNLVAGIPQSGWEYFMREDKKYVAVPSMRSAVTDIEYLHIRRDWLDKVGKDVPGNVEELEDALRLFKDQKLGGSVTIPLAIENPIWVQLNFLNGPWMPDATEQFKLMAEGKNIELTGALHEERLEMLQRWYRDGLLNNEWTSWKYDQVYDACAKGMIGCLSGGWGLTNQQIQNVIMKADPSQDWVQIFPPVGRKGVANSGRVRTGHPLERGLVVATWAPSPEALIAFTDWDNASLENHLTSRFGIPDKHWKLGEGGAIVDLRTPGKPEYSGMRGTTWTTELFRKRALAPAPPGKPLLDPEVPKRVLTNIHTRKDPTKPETNEYPAIPYIDRYVPYKYPSSERMDGDMNTVFAEYLTRIVNGELKPKEGGQEAYSRWLAAGGEVKMREITDQYNAWIGQHPEWKDPRATFAPEAWNTTIKYPDRPKR